MNLGPRSILLIVAIVLFIIGALGNNPDFLFWGLAAFAGSFLIGDFPMGRRPRG